MSNFDYRTLSKRLATPFSLSDTARQAVKLLGEDWHAESGYWGATGEITTLDGARFIVGVDHEGDLYVHADKRAEPTSLTEYFDCTSAFDGLEEVAKRVVALILDIDEATPPVPTRGAPTTGAPRPSRTAQGTSERQAMIKIFCGECDALYGLRADGNFQCDGCRRLLSPEGIDLDSGEVWVVNAAGTLGRGTDPIASIEGMELAMDGYTDCDNDSYGELAALRQFREHVSGLQLALYAGLPYPRATL
ncbi:hypothetical protein [Streptomyces sp. NPDC058657]|uniref:hypothetical protein n=1 Tax=unclassified Streptomyces TaxID=2593676 RepID=UPI003660E12B